MAKKINLPNLIRDNQARWDSAKFDPRRLATAKSVAARLVAPKAKVIYQELEATTGVPWYFIAVVHEREASQRWDRNIAQGDRWDRKSVNIPRGRGPFRSFKEAAIDALTNCAPYASRWKDWSEGGCLTILELYNGTGYELYHNMPSPYLWSGTQHYKRGKYVGDKKWSDTEVDQQLGVAILLKQMMAIDSDVTFGQPAGGHAVPVADVPAPESSGESDIVPDDYPDGPDAPTHGDEPPAPEGGATNYVDGPPPAGGSGHDFGADLDKLKDAGFAKLATKAIGEKVGTKAVATGAAVSSTAVAAADDSWFNFIGQLMHSPRFWIIAVIVTAFAAYLIYNCVHNYKAKKGLA